MASLQDQLLKAGIVDQKKAKQLNKEKRKQAKQQPKGSAPVDDTKERARRTLAEKSERDRQENRELQAQAEKKAIKAQIIQLISMNRIARGQGEIAYQFTDQNKIKKLFVTAPLQSQLIKGQIAIVRQQQAYELVPAVVAEKIKQRNEAAVILLNSNAKAEPDEDDPYADYQIPDDLMW